MKAAKEFLEEKGFVPERTFRIPSRSAMGEYRTVELFKDGTITCDCPAGVFKNDCYHKKIVRRQYSKTIQVNVKTIFQGQVAIRDKYIKDAQKNFWDLCIDHQNRRMIIPCKEIKKSITGKSKQPVKDKWRNEKHYLLYFLWKPTDNQTTLKL